MICANGQVEIRVGDCRDLLRAMPDQSVNCIVTSPPYFGLRDYGTDGQIGLESSPDAFVAEMVAVFREARRVLRDDGTCWVNLGDSYSATGGNTAMTGGRHDASRGLAMGFGNLPAVDTGLRPKNLLGIPWRVAFALQADGWYLRQDIIWAKPNPMPESVRDRCTKAHEYVFLLTKSARYWYDADAVKETSIHAGRVVEYDGTQKNSAAAADPKMRTRLATTVQVADTRNKRSVWTVATQPFSDWTEIVRWDRVEQDAVSDDSLHIAFPNCPSYGGLFDLLAMAGCDGHVGDGLLRSLRTYGRLSEEPQHGFVPIDQILAWSFGERRLDELLGWCSETAIGRSIRSRKTGLFLATSPACTPSDERRSRIERTLAKLGSSAQHLDIDASNIWASGFVESRRPQTLWRNVGKSDVSGLSGAYALFYGKNTQKTSHFATYPPALIEPCILAGCPKGGTVLDPFGGAGTTGLVAARHHRQAILCELNPAYAEMAHKRISREWREPVAGDVEPIGGLFA